MPVAAAECLALVREAAAPHHMRPRATEARRHLAQPSPARIVAEEVEELVLEFLAVDAGLQAGEVAVEAR